jgi:hypothetical protein
MQPTADNPLWIECCMQREELQGEWGAVHHPRTSQAKAYMHGLSNVALACAEGQPPFSTPKYMVLGPYTLPRIVELELFSTPGASCSLMQHFSTLKKVGVRAFFCMRPIAPLNRPRSLYLSLENSSLCFRALLLLQAALSTPPSIAAGLGTP